MYMHFVSRHAYTTHIVIGHPFGLALQVQSTNVHDSVKFATTLHFSKDRSCRAAHFVWDYAHHRFKEAWDEM